jgi:uncharacterized protein YkwD
MFKDFFIPTQHNGYYPISIQPRFLYTYLVFMLIFNLFTANFFSQLPTSVNAQTTFSSTDIIYLTNQDRLSNNLPVLTENTDLDSAATAKAADMFKYQYWAHYNPSTGASPWSFIVANGFNYTYAGENLAEGFTDAASVETAWMNSQEHRDNILNAHYDDIGVSVTYGNLQGSNTILVVEMFGALAKNHTITPNATPTTTNAPTSTPTLIPTVQATLSPKATPSSTTTPTKTITPSPSSTPSPSPTVTPKVTAVPAVVVSVTPTPPVRVKGAGVVHQPTLIEAFATQVTAMKFTNKINLIMALFLFLIFALDAIYYYQVRNIQKRLRPNSIAHLPLLSLLIVICLIGTTGFTL